MIRYFDCAEKYREAEGELIREFHFQNICIDDLKKLPNLKSINYAIVEYHQNGDCVLEIDMNHEFKDYSSHISKVYHNVSITLLNLEDKIVDTVSTYLNAISDKEDSE